MSCAAHRLTGTVVGLGVAPALGDAAAANLRVVAVAAAAGGGGHEEHSQSEWCGLCCCRQRCWNARCRCHLYHLPCAVVCVMVRDLVVHHGQLCPERCDEVTRPFPLGYSHRHRHGQLHRHLQPHAPLPTRLSLLPLSRPQTARWTSSTTARQCDRAVGLTAGWRQRRRRWSRRSEGRGCEGTRTRSCSRTWSTPTARL